MDNYDIEMWRYSKELKKISTNEILGHEHRRPSSAILQKIEININEWGLRGAPLTEKDYDRTILFLGSSITLGWGVPEEKTITKLIENRLNRDSNQTVRVLNGGIGNYNATRYVERFMTRLKDLRPTDVVVHYFINDAEILDRGRNNYLLRNSMVAVTGWTVFNRFSRKFSGETLEEHYRKIYTLDSNGYRQMTYALERLSKYAKENNIAIYLALTPDIHNLKDYPYTYTHDMVDKSCSSMGYHVIDLYPAFEGIEGKEIWAMPGDPHPNELGHQLMAEQLIPALMQRDK